MADPPPGGPPARPPLRAVTFDYWNTLLHESPGQMSALRRKAWAARLGDAGRAVADHELAAAFEGSWRRYVERWEANRQYLAREAAHDLLLELGLGALEDELREALIEDFTAIGHDAELLPTPGIGETLAALKAAGLRIGIVCDVGMTPSPILRVHLERHGLLEHFDHWSFSDEVGCYNPDPAIFEHALAGLGGVEPAAAAHVGDLRRTDIAGARGMGMVAVRYVGVADDDQPGPEGDLVCADHTELPGLLGVDAA